MPKYHSGSDHTPLRASRLYAKKHRTREVATMLKQDEINAGWTALVIEKGGA